MSDLQSRPFHPDPEKCCEACVFGGAAHAQFCAMAKPRRKMRTSTLIGMLLACSGDLPAIGSVGPHKSLVGLTIPDRIR